MGREIRMVPLEWKHPKRVVAGFHGDEERFIPLYGRSYQTDMDRWNEEKAKWDAGERPSYFDVADDCTFEEWEGVRPCQDDYMPVFDEPCDGWCVYENVSEGTPVTPVFGTPWELVDYLCEHGDFADQARRARGFTLMPCAPWPREAAEGFVMRHGYRPSMVMGNGVVSRFIDAAEDE